MREGSTINNPINGQLYKSLYPKFKLPNSTYISYKKTLYFKKHDKLDFIRPLFSNTKRPKDEKSQLKSTDRQYLKKLWIKKWKLEIAAQKHG